MRTAKDKLTGSLHCECVSKNVSIKLSSGSREGDQISSSFCCLCRQGCNFCKTGLQIKGYWCSLYCCDFEGFARHVVSCCQKTKVRTFLYLKDALHPSRKKVVWFPHAVPLLYSKGMSIEDSLNAQRSLVSDHSEAKPEATFSGFAFDSR